MTLIIGSLQLGFIYAWLALGVTITFRILDIPDLTAEGSFTCGVAISSILSFHGHPFLGILLGIAGGMLAGTVTGLLQTKAGIHPILAGILTMSGLYSVNLFILGGQPNISLLGKTTLFSFFADKLAGIDRNLIKLLIIAVISILAIALLVWFFRTNLGLCIRATGDNEHMVRASSINVDSMKIIALAIANGFIALSGAVLAQYQGFGDINTGVGIIVVGLASVIIGEVFFGRRSLAVSFISALTGSIIYRFIIALALKTDFFPAYGFKLLSAVIVAIALSIPAIQQKWAEHKIKKEGKDRASN
ncbi:ABC transporter permease [Anaerolentibacter hominis]|uniref:ABC transporter permease n=1 Tax=Anaerolentibacter hominis TaxID=3079009 RepID=UPI0031B82A9C